MHHVHAPQPGFASSSTVITGVQANDVQCKRMPCELGRMLHNLAFIAHHSRGYAKSV